MKASLGHMITCLLTSPVPRNFNDGLTTLKALFSTVNNINTDIGSEAFFLNLFEHTTIPPQKKKDILLFEIAFHFGEFSKVKFS